MTPLTVGLIAGLGGAAGGYVIRHLLLTRKQEDLEAKQREILLNAKDEALKIKEEAKKAGLEVSFARPPRISDEEEAPQRIQRRERID